MPGRGADRDHDGIPDSLDKCPDKPETYNGYQDEDGCPDRGPALVAVDDKRIITLAKIDFAKDVVQGAASLQVLAAVAGIMNGHREVWVVEVAARVPRTANPAEDLALSQRRADWIMKYLVSKGIGKSRLVARGHGSESPPILPKPAAEPGKSGSVDFVILRSTKNPGNINMIHLAPFTSTRVATPPTAPGNSAPGPAVPRSAPPVRSR